MENEGKGKQCYKCRYLDRYYTKEAKGYKRTQVGLCGKKMEIMNIHDCCEKYELKKVSKRTEQQICGCLNDLLSQINEIRAVLEDGKNETM